MEKIKEKTNAIRALEQKKIPFTFHEYPSDVALSGVEVAELIGQPLQKVYKTLVTVGKSNTHYVFVVPAAAELDLKKAAKAAGEKKRGNGQIEGIVAAYGICAWRLFPRWHEKAVCYVYRRFSGSIVDYYSQRR